jgi:hypothetical protein
MSRSRVPQVIVNALVDDSGDGPCVVRRLIVTEVGGGTDIKKRGRGKG